MDQGSNIPTAVDLFCGAGGLTLGLKKAGFNVIAGVEIDPEIAKTYKVNHPMTKLLIKDIREVTGKEIFELTSLKKVDLIAGCPPCQGFSKLTDKYHKNDPRNDLVFEMVRLIQEIEPKMVMMENVPGLANRGRPILDEFVSRIESMGYLVNKRVLQLADYGIPQSRKRFVLLAGKGFPIQLPKQTHYYKGDKKKKLKPWLTLGDVIKNTRRPITFLKAKKRGGPQKFSWHVVRDLKTISKNRLRALREGGSRDKLPKKLRPKCHKKSDKGFQNVYGRLSWKHTPPTITRGCTTPAMGRFGHPSQLRTISVREAALIQTFPRSYKFSTESINTVCNLIGNALPPKFAQRIAKICVNVLEKQNSDTNVYT